MPFDTIQPPTVGAVLAREVLHPGERLGPYEAVELLSFGMTGGIYRALIQPSGEPCTLWVTPTLLARDREWRKRLQGLGTTMHGLRNPHVLQFRRLGWEGQRCCLEFEPFEGLSLERVLLDAPGDAWPPLDAQDVAHLLSGVAISLGAAHLRGVCHHNLVPANILFQPDGSARVVGFGFIDALGHELFQELASVAVPPVRTPELERTLQSTEMRGPEVHMGKPATRATDVYHLGLLAYFLLTGRRFSTGAPSPHSLRPELARGWDNLVGRCLNPAPGLRPMNIPRLAQELDGVASLAPQPGSIWRDGGKPVRQKRRLPRKFLVAGGCVAALALAAGGWFFLNGGDSGPDGVEIKPAASAASANLILHIDPPTGAVARISGAGTGRLPETGGTVLARLPRGNYRVIVDAPDYKAATFLIAMKGQRDERTLQLEPQTGDLQVSTIPGASVYAMAGDHRLFVGKADGNGKLDVADRLLARQQTLLVQAPGYAGQKFEVAVAAGANPPLQAPLQAVGVPVTVLAQPPGATVYIDGTRAGQAPLRLDSVQPGATLTLRVEAPGFRTAERTLTLDPGAPQTVDFGTLQRQMGTVDLQLAYALPNDSGQPPTATVDGQPVDASAPLTLTAGSHVIAVNHPDYLPAQATVEVADRQQASLPVELRPRPAVIDLHATPDVPLTVRVDGQPVTKGPISVPAGRDVAVEVRAHDFLPATETVHLRPNEHQSWDLQLVPLPGPVPGRDWALPYTGETLKWLPAGDFAMGSPPREVENRPNEGPQTRVNFSHGFWILPYEVRQSFWAGFMQANPSEYKGPDLPVQDVTWDEAAKFCDQLTQRERAAGRLPEGYVYRLPTEAEWEYAARAGTTTPFAWGSKATEADGNFQGTYPRATGSGTVSSDKHFGPVAAGKYAPNAWGLYDMHGNVAEWCANLFNGRLPGGSVTDWKGPADGRDRPVRGGNWSDFADRARSAARDRLEPSTRSPAVGFRIVLAPAL